MIKIVEMSVINQAERKKQKQKPLGAYLVEAGLITPNQVEIALNEQKVNRRRLGEILVLRGWVKQQTIEYLMENVVLPERRAVKENRGYRESKEAGGEKDRATSRHAPSVIKKNFRPSGGSARSEDSLAFPAPTLFIHLSPRRTIRFLLFAVISLGVASIVGQFSLYLLPDYPLKYTFASLFNVDGELTIPAVYSAVTLLLCSVLLAIIAYTKKISADRYVRHWGALSIIFLVLSLDEILGLHEIMFSPLGSELQPSSGFYSAWVILGVTFVFICLLAFGRFLAAIPLQTRRLFLTAGTLFVGGAIGMKLVGGYYADSYALHSQPLNMTYAIITTIEELLEMLAIIVFIYALLSYISFSIKGVSLQVNIIKDRKQRST